MVRPFRLVHLATGVTHAAVIENLEASSIHCGIFIFSGWKCEADGAITLRFDSGPDFPVADRSEGTATNSVCGDTDNGRVLLFNYNLLPKGVNFVQAIDAGQESVSGASRQCSTEVAVNTVQLEWQEGREGCDITRVGPADGFGNCLVPDGSPANTPKTQLCVTGGTDRQAVDIYRIQGVSLLRPALLVLRGGYWTSASKACVYPLQFQIARLADDPAAPWPGIIHYVKAASAGYVSTPGSSALMRVSRPLKCSVGRTSVAWSVQL